MKDTRKLVMYGLLMAIILLMSFTPIGYLKVGVVEISFLMIPVVVGSIVLGPATGAFMGGLFGITSFIQCFGASPFGAALLAINAPYTFIVCMVPRILAGWLCGLLFRFLYKKLQKGNLIAFAVANTAGALLNTVLFMSTLILLFPQTDAVMGITNGKNIFEIVLAVISVNALVEAGVCFIVGTAISKAVYKTVNRL